MNKLPACRAEVPGAKVEAVSVDLADLSTIRTFAGKALDGGRPLDVLVNNAGKLMSHIHVNPACKLYQVALSSSLWAALILLGNCEMQQSCI